MGMIPALVKIGTEAVACPHTHGDDPYYGSDKAGFIYLSPHAWG